MGRTMHEIVHTGILRTNKFVMKESVDKLDQLFSYFLKYQKLFKEVYADIPEYKRKAIMELLMESEEG